MQVFVDESGHSADTESASDHFIVSGVAVRDRNLHRIRPALDLMREQVNRAGKELHWNKIDSHSQRLHLAQSINRLTWIRTISIVVCKRHLSASEMESHERYRWTLRLLLERVSWLARDEAKERAHIVVSHMKGFDPATLAEYERVLRTMQPPEVRIAWDSLDPAGCEVVHKDDREELQLADLVASATGSAFEPDRFGNVERRYLAEMRKPIWDHSGGDILTYGLKLHPKRALDCASYSWLRALQPVPTVSPRGVVEAH